jgi:formylglycine-generating enzyme required for sulfatase activity
MLKAVSPVVSIHLEPEMVQIPAGTFRQGDSWGEDTSSDHPLRDVHIKKFALGRFEVTFEEYDRFAMATGQPFPRDEGWGRERRPVINVSWEDAVNYASWLSEGTGRRFRLPTEAEWEYAARNRGKEEIWAGTSDQEQLTTYAWFNTNSTGRTQPVGTKKANGLGLQDMSGNVWEWVEDCWHDDYQHAPTNGSAWLEAHNGNCGIRVRRGGSWTNSPMSLRSSLRNGYSADSRSIQIGFRLAEDID